MDSRLARQSPAGGEVAGMEKPTVADDGAPMTQLSIHLMNQAALPPHHCEFR